MILESALERRVFWVKLMFLPNIYRITKYLLLQQFAELFLFSAEMLKGSLLIRDVSWEYGLYIQLKDLHLSHPSIYAK